MVADPKVNMPDPHRDSHEPEPASGSGRADSRPAWASVRQVFRQLGPAGPLALVASALPLLGELVLFCLLAFLAPRLRSLGVSGAALYAIGFALTSGLAILPTHIQSALGGWAFGFKVGFPAAVAGVLGGALLGYWIARRASGARVLRLIEEQPKWAAVHRSLVGGSFGRTLLVVTLLRLAVTPFAMTNLVLAAVGVGPGTYLLGTVLGLAPRTGAVVFLAHAVNQLTFGKLEHRWLWISSMILTAITVLVIGHMAQRAAARVTADNAPAAAGAVTARETTAPSSTPIRDR